MHSSILFGFSAADGWFLGVDCKSGGYTQCGITSMDNLETMNSIQLLRCIGDAQVAHGVVIVSAGHDLPLQQLAIVAAPSIQQLRCNKLTWHDLSIPQLPYHNYSGSPVHTTTTTITRAALSMQQLAAAALPIQQLQRQLFAYNNYSGSSAHTSITAAALPMQHIVLPPLQQNTEAYDLPGNNTVPITVY